MNKEKRRPALTPDVRNKQLIALAYDQAEERLRSGKASSAEIVHFLKLGSTKEQLEEEILEKQKELMVAKTKAYENADLYTQKIEEAIKAMYKYGGKEDE